MVHKKYGLVESDIKIPKEILSALEKINIALKEKPEDLQNDDLLETFFDLGNYALHSAKPQPGNRPG